MTFAYDEPVLHPILGGGKINPFAILFHPLVLNVPCVLIDAVPIVLGFFSHIPLGKLQRIPSPRHMHVAPATDDR